MSNQYTKIPLFIEDDFFIDDISLIESLSSAVIDILEDILPKDIESVNSLISKIKLEL
ncbi:hypothetical protein ACEE21_12150 [Clostridium baratii]|uniref:Uncharacterized protein n=1 Tax=Clostridium nitritogenes TaxID=83340 RepID=A0ABN1LTI8_9CLOT|nr:hypothetical protein [Clostridium baratii]MDY3207696.1 hypothetical protein [Clostridium baratii]